MQLPLWDAAAIKKKHFSALRDVNTSSAGMPGSEIAIVVSDIVKYVLSTAHNAHVTSDGTLKRVSGS